MKNETVQFHQSPTEIASAIPASAEVSNEPARREEAARFLAQALAREREQERALELARQTRDQSWRP